MKNALRMLGLGALLFGLMFGCSSELSEAGSVEVNPLLTKVEVVEMQDSATEVELSAPLREYIVILAAATRKSDNIAVGVSPRGSTSLLTACQAWAASDGRSFVVPEDVQTLAPHVWAHRILAGLEQDIAAGREAISELLTSVPVPL